MKNISAVLVSAALLAFVTTGYSQQRDTSSASYHYKKGAEKTGEKMKQGARKAEHETSKAAANGAAHVKDKVYEGKTGPDGQTVYIDENSKYYYIDNRGKKTFVAKSSLKDKQ